MRLDLILWVKDIYINSNLNPLTKFTRSNRSNEFKDTLPKVLKTIPISSRMVISYAIKRVVLSWP